MNRSALGGRGAPAGSDADGGPGELDLLALSRRMLKGWWIMALMTGAALAAAVFYLKTAPKRYQSTATILVEQERRPLLPANAPDGGREDIRALEILKTIEQGIVSQNNLRRVAEVNRLATDEGFAVASSEAELVKILGSRVTSELRRGTRLIDITVEDTNPERARRLAASLVDEYIAATGVEALEAAQAVAGELRRNAERLKAKINQTNDELSAYREKHQNVALGKESTLASDKLRELNTRLTQVMAERTRAEAAAREIATLGPRPDMDAIMKLQGGAVGVEISQLKGTLAQKEAAFAMLQQRYLSQHPKYIAATNELRALRAKVADFSTNALTTLKANLAHLAATETDLRAQVGRAQVEVHASERVSGPYRLMLSQLQSDQTSFDAVQAELKQAEIAALTPPSALALADAPIASTKPAKPSKKIVLGVAGIGGLGLGAGLAFAAALFRRRFETVRETEAALHVPFLAAIPSAGRRRRFPLLGEPKVEKTCAESFRTLRTAISVLGQAGAPGARSVLFVSADRGEGTSFVAANHALSLARQGYRTLLIDANLHSPVLDEVFFSERNPAGLAAYLEGRAAEGDPCRSTRFPDLYLLSAGVTPLHPSELLSGRKFQLLLEDAQRWFHRIVIDAPSLSASTDALLMARQTEHTVLVVNGSHGHSGLTTEVCRRLAQAGVTPAGFVFNEAPAGSAPWQPSSPKATPFLSSRSLKA